jgi:glycosyltransferase involved in cell wall biosynthesis
MDDPTAISQPKLSIMVPAFGESPYLCETLESLATNTNSNSVRIYVVDDSSPTDNVREICAAYSDRVTYIRNEKNIGLAANFQNCINLSKSEYTMIMGSDDRVLNGLESAFDAAIQKWPSTVVLQLGVKVIDESGRPVKGLPERVKSLISPSSAVDYSSNGLGLVKRLLIGDWFYFPAIIWQTETLKNYSLQNNYRTAVDLDLLLNMALKDEVFTFSSAPSFEYRRHSESVSSQLSQNEQRVREELSVHANFIKKAHELGYMGFDSFAKLAITIRLHAFKSGIAMSVRNPKLASRIIKIALSPISLSPER